MNAPDVCRTCKGSGYRASDRARAAFFDDPRANALCPACGGTGALHEDDGPEPPTGAAGPTGGTEPTGAAGPFRPDEASKVPGHLAPEIPAGLVEAARAYAAEPHRRMTRWRVALILTAAPQVPAAFDELLSRAQRYALHAAAICQLDCSDADTAAACQRRDDALRALADRVVNFLALSQRLAQTEA